MATLDRNVHAIEGVSVSFLLFSDMCSDTEPGQLEKREREAVPKKKKGGRSSEGRPHLGNALVAVNGGFRWAIRSSGEMAEDST